MWLQALKPGRSEPFRERDAKQTMTAAARTPPPRAKDRRGSGGSSPGAAASGGALSPSIRIAPGTNGSLVISPTQANADAKKPTNIKRGMPLYLQNRPASPNELGGTRKLQAPQVLSTKHSAPAYSFGGSTARTRLPSSTSPGPVYGLGSTLGGANISFGTSEQRPRPGHQRRYSRQTLTPSPASYSLPPSIGSGQVLERMRSAPSVSFGTAPQRALPFSSQNTPGAKYQIDAALTRTGKAAAIGLAWSNQPRYPDMKDVASLPGPASYDIVSSIGAGNIESTLSNAPAVGFGTAMRSETDFMALELRQKQHIPGVGTYDHTSMLGEQHVSDKRSPGGVVWPHADRFKPIAVEEKFIDGQGFGARARGRARAPRPTAPRARTVSVVPRPARPYSFSDPLATAVASPRAAPQRRSGAISCPARASTSSEAADRWRCPCRRLERDSRRSRGLPRAA